MRSPSAAKLGCGGFLYRFAKKLLGQKQKFVALMLYSDNILKCNTKYREIVRMARPSATWIRSLWGWMLKTDGW